MKAYHPSYNMRRNEKQFYSRKNQEGRIKVQLAASQYVTYSKCRRCMQLLCYQDIAFLFVPGTNKAPTACAPKYCVQRLGCPVFFETIFSAPRNNISFLSFTLCKNCFSLSAFNPPKGSLLGAAKKCQSGGRRLGMGPDA